MLIAPGEGGNFVVNAYRLDSQPARYFPCLAVFLSGIYNAVTEKFFKGGQGNVFGDFPAEYKPLFQPVFRQIADAAGNGLRRFLAGKFFPVQDDTA